MWIGGCFCRLPGVISMRRKLFLEMRRLRRYFLLVLPLLAAGCAADREPEIYFPGLEIWDCRSDPPRRLFGVDGAVSKSDDDFLTPNFTGLELPKDDESSDGPDGPEHK